MASMAEMNAPYLVATLDRYENDKAVLIFDNNQKLIISKELIFGDFKEGDTLIFFLTKDKNLQLARENFAKDVLNTLLKKN